MEKVIWKENKRINMGFSAAKIPAGTENSLQHIVHLENGTSVDIESVKEGDVVLSWDTDIVPTVVNENRIGEITDGIVLKISTKYSSIIYTSNHLIKYYREDKLIEDNIGTLQVGDEIIYLIEDEDNSSNFTLEKIVSIDEVEIEDTINLIHPITELGYLFVNNILVEG